MIHSIFIPLDSTIQAIASDCATCTRCATAFARLLVIDFDLALVVSSNFHLHIKKALFRIDRHATIIAHVFMSTRGNIKQRSLSTIWIPHKGYINHTTLICSHALHTSLQLQFEFFVFIFTRNNTLQTFFRMQTDIILCLTLANHLNELGFLTTQGYLIPHYLILYRVVQRSIKYYLYRLPLYKPHFNDTLAKAAMASHFHNYATFPCM